MVKLHSLALTLNASEQATIKAALIYWRNLETRPENLEYLAGNCGEISHLDTEELDQLIAKVSTPELMPLVPMLPAWPQRVGEGRGGAAGIGFTRRGDASSMGRTHPLPTASTVALPLSTRTY